MRKRKKNKITREKLKMAIGLCDWVLRKFPLYQPPVDGIFYSVIFGNKDVRYCAKWQKKTKKWIMFADNEDVTDKVCGWFQSVPMSKTTKEKITWRGEKAEVT